MLAAVPARASSQGARLPEAAGGAVVPLDPAVQPWCVARVVGLEVAFLGVYQNRLEDAGLPDAAGGEESGLTFLPN